MNVDSAALSLEKPKAHQAIFWGGLIAGTLDILTAFINSGLRGAGPTRVLQAIASGLLGAEAFEGGFTTAALGLALHFFIATTATAVYYAASRKLKLLVDQPIVCGLAYGIPVYVVMNLIVLPLSAVPFKPPHTLGTVVTAALILMFCVGLPIALVVRRYSE
ncbi:MAG: hypothetical protein ONB48_19325 [candidate division KSB1 bacterium]|nr:hypothetical protein [candidate division KSB1 bacterium]MDZ7274157.1 hypothetical protein [candidate division KSB1 bacterium]MDZ7287798.1 hypothetical protein [candidate division KSB1 bacterium]MDZ7296756.1 hypothetical protein [candidate division KSB1 bacterium]MDZ7347622.1 hypothetical protein [candidate division KSB1 bacterium]